jgi:AraC-like DNA-binding protein
VSVAVSIAASRRDIGTFSGSGIHRSIISYPIPARLGVERTNFANCERLAYGIPSHCGAYRYCSPIHRRSPCDALPGIDSSMNENSPSGVLVSRFSTSSYRAHERIAAWREVFGRTVLSIDITPRSTEGFHASALASRCSNFGLLHASTSAADQANSRSLIASDDVSFGVVTTCRWGASQLGRSADLHPGDGVLMSNGDVGALTFPNDCRYVTFSIPRTAIKPLVPDIGALFARRVPASNPALQMLVRYLELARSGHVLSTPGLAAAYTDHVSDLLALSVGATSDGAELAKTRGLCAARLHAMKEDMRKTLDRPDLSVHSIAARHRVSVRYVQKLFEESGCTFTRFVMEERLTAAYDVLTVRSNVPINRIAYDLGFSDLSYFNRAFRQRFGCTPSDVRNCAPAR